MREERREAEASAPPRSASAGAAAATDDGRRRAPGRRRTQARRAGDLEREVERAEAALAAVEDELADPAKWSSPVARERNAERHARAKRAVDEAYARWEQATRSA